MKIMQSEIRDLAIESLKLLKVKGACLFHSFLSCQRLCNEFSMRTRLCNGRDRKIQASTRSRPHARLDDMPVTYLGRLEGLTRSMPSCLLLRQPCPRSWLLPQEPT